MPKENPNPCLVQKIGLCEGCNILEMIRNQPAKSEKIKVQEEYCPNGEKIHTTENLISKRQNLW